MSIGAPQDAERRYRGLLAALGDESALGAVAAFRLAHLVRERGAHEEAIVLWERAIRGPDENLRPRVLVELAGRLRACGRRDQAERLYAQAIATDHPDLAPHAALTLGGLREEAGVSTAALELYALVSASQHPDHASDAEARRVALLHRRTRRAIEQMLLIDLKHACNDQPDDEPSARECANHRGAAAHFAAVPGWCRRPRAEPEPPDDLEHLTLIALGRAYGLCAFETDPDGLWKVPDVMSGAGVGPGTFADPAMNIETAKNLLLCHFSAEHESPWEAVSAPTSVDPNRQPNMLIEGPTIALAFGDTSASVRDIRPTGPASSDQLLMSHITHALTALRCKEALFTGSLIGTRSSRWSDAIDGFTPGLATWRALSEGPAAACRCKNTTCGPGTDCLRPRRVGRAEASRSLIDQ